MISSVYIWVYVYDIISAKVTITETELGLDRLSMYERRVGRLVSAYNILQDGGVVVVLVSARRYKQKRERCGKGGEKYQKKSPQKNSPTVQYVPLPRPFSFFPETPHRYEGIDRTLSFFLSF